MELTKDGDAIYEFGEFFKVKKDKDAGCYFWVTAPHADLTNRAKLENQIKTGANKIPLAWLYNDASTLTDAVIFVNNYGGASWDARQTIHGLLAGSRQTERRTKYIMMNDFIQNE